MNEKAFTQMSHASIDVFVKIKDRNPRCIMNTIVAITIDLFFSLTC